MPEMNAAEANWMKVANGYRERLREIETTIEEIEIRSGKGSDPKAAIATMKDHDYQYIRKMAMIP